MKRYVRAYKFLRYNANPRGTKTGDCQTRAIAMAFDMTWDEVRKALREGGFDGNTFKMHWHVSDVLETKFHCKLMDISLNSLADDTKYLTVGEFCDTYGKQGTYLILCNSKGESDYGNHIVCSIDGTIYDTWDSADCRVVAVYQPTQNYRTDGIKFDSDIPRRINKLAAMYEECFDRYISQYEFTEQLRNRLPSADFSGLSGGFGSANADFPNSYNFVVNVHYKLKFKAARFDVNKIKKFNISFNESDTYADVVKNMDTQVSALVDKWMSSIISQMVTSYNLIGELGDTKYKPTSQKFIKAFAKIDPMLRRNVVNMETFCGYTCATINVSTPDYPCYVLVMSESVSYLNECLSICTHYDYDFWRKRGRIHILPPWLYISIRSIFYRHI